MTQRVPATLTGKKGEEKMTNTHYSGRWRFGMRDNSLSECMKTAALLLFMFSLLAWAWYAEDKDHDARVARKTPYTDAQIAALKLSPCEHGRAMGLVLSGHPYTPDELDLHQRLCSIIPYRQQTAQLKALTLNAPVPSAKAVAQDALRTPYTETEIASLKLTPCERGRAMALVRAGQAFTPTERYSDKLLCEMYPLNDQAAQLRVLEPEFTADNPM